MLIQVYILGFLLSNSLPTFVTEPSTVGLRASLQVQKLPHRFYLS